MLLSSCRLQYQEIRAHRDKYNYLFKLNPVRFIVNRKRDEKFSIAQEGALRLRLCHEDTIVSDDIRKQEIAEKEEKRMNGTYWEFLLNRSIKR